LSLSTNKFIAESKSEKVLKTDKVTAMSLVSSFL